MPKCTTPSIEFGRLGRKKIEANFNGGAISSDGGLMLLRQVDRKIGLSKAVAKAIFGQLYSKCQGVVSNNNGGKKKFKFKNKLVSLDSSTITLTLSMYDWASYRRAKGLE